MENKAEQFSLQSKKIYKILDQPWEKMDKLWHIE